MLSTNIPTAEPTTKRTINSTPGADADADDEFTTEPEDEVGAETDDEFSGENDASADLEADPHELQAELGEDWILYFSVHSDDTWLTAEKDDASQRVEAPTASVLSKAVKVLNAGGGRPTSTRRPTRDSR